MDEKELEELKKSNPKAHEAYVKLKGELDEERKKIKSREDDEEDDSEDDEERRRKKKARRKDDEEEDDSEDDDLRVKARKHREREEGRVADQRRLEGALKFNLGLTEFVKANVDLLPKEVQDIVRLSEKERYDSALDKASALKAAIIDAFFQVQSNLDSLTPGQKGTLDDYLKLSKNGRETKAESIFENIFEPALETMKKVKKAEELGKGKAGFGTSSKGEEDYKNRLMQTSRKTYLGEKGA